MADYIPPEYAAQLAGLQRNKAISQALLQNSLTSRPTEVVGNRAVKQGGLEAIIRALTGGVAGYNLRQGDEEEAGVMSQIAQNRAQNAQRALADPKSGLTSLDPRAQAIAEAAIKRQTEQRAAGAKGIFESGDTQGGLTYLNGEGDNPLYTPSERKKPEVGSMKLPDGRTVATVKNYDKYGIEKLDLDPAPVINNNMPAQRDLAYNAIKPEIQKRQIDADLARDSLAANRTAREALNEGAKTGSGGEFFQSVRKVMGAFGVDAEGKVPTEKLAMALGNHILANAKKLAPVTEEDIKTIKSIVGSLDTEPQNLARIFEIMDAASIKTLQNYNKYIDVSTAGIQNEFGDSLRGMKVGYETPELSGNTTQAFRTLQELKARGGDISQYQDPTGEQIPANARFDIRGLGLPKPVVPSKDPKKMTADERAAEIQSLKAALAAAEAARAGK